MKTLRQINIKSCPHFFNDIVNINSENSLYLTFNDVDGYIECKSTEESNEYKYLIFDSRDKNKEVSEKYTEL